MTRVAEDDPPIGRRPLGPLALLDNRVRSLGCARCGMCCEEIVLGFDPRVPVRGGDPGNAELYRDYWHVEWVDDHGQPDRPAWRSAGYVVTCSAYDADRQLCTHPDRPSICADYPFYELPPTSERRAERHFVRDQDGVRQPFGCSYGLDSPGWSQVTRPLIPVEVLSRG